MNPNLKRSDTLAIDPEEPTLWVSPGYEFVQALLVPLYDHPMEDMPAQILVDLRTGAVQMNFNNDTPQLNPPPPKQGFVDDEDDDE